MPEKSGQSGHPAGPSGRWPGDMGEPIAEGLTFAGWVLTSPSRQADPQRDRRSLSRQVLQMANLPAVTPGGLDITPGTPSAPLSDGRDRPASLATLGTQELEAGPKRPFGIFHHAPSGQSPSQSSTKTSITRIEEDPFHYSATTLKSWKASMTPNVQLGGWCRGGQPPKPHSASQTSERAPPGAPQTATRRELRDVRRDCRLNGQRGRW
jgi:hypothetical protein